MLLKERIKMWKSISRFSRSLHTSHRANSSLSQVSNDFQMAFQNIESKKQPLSLSDERFVNLYFYKKRPSEFKLRATELTRLMMIAKKYQLYEDGIKILENNLEQSSITMSLLMESSSFMAEYCANFQKLGPSFIVLVERLEEAFDTLTLPSSIANPISINLNYALAMCGSNKSLPPDVNLLQENGRLFESQRILARYYLELAARDQDMREFCNCWSNFTELFSRERYSVFDQPSIFMAFLKAIEVKNPDIKKRRADTISVWLYERLSLSAEPLADLHWPILQVFNNALGFSSIAVDVDQSGKIVVQDGPLQNIILSSSLKLPLKLIEEEKILACWNELHQLLSKLKKSKSSITSKELELIQNEAQLLKSQLKDQEKILIVDTLNAFQGPNQNQPNSMASFLEKMKLHFQYILLITRRHALSSIRCFSRNDPRVRIIYGDDRTEDDLLVLVATAKIGPSAWILSNDRFGRYRQMFQEEYGANSSKNFAQWIQARAMRHIPLFSFETMAFFNRDVRKLETKEANKSIFLIPVVKENGLIPEYNYHLVVLPKMQAPNPGLPQTVSPFPAPPEFSKNYTIERLKANHAPPPPPVQHEFTVFGEEYRLDDDIIRPLSLQKITQLYPSNKVDWKTEMKKLNKSAVAAFLDLLEILIRNPESQDRLDKLDDIRTIFINMHHLINEFRPLQARLTLQSLQRDQIVQLEDTISKFKTFMSGDKSALRAVLDMSQIELKPVPPKPSWLEAIAEDEPAGSVETLERQSKAIETITGHLSEVSITPKPTRAELRERKLIDQKFIDSM